MTQQFSFWVIFWKKKKKNTLNEKDIHTCTFITALFTIVMVWKQIGAMDRWMDKEIHILYVFEMKY